MKNLFSALAIVAILAPGAAFAAMPNYVGNDYKQGSDCVVGDHGVFEIVSGSTIEVGCLTPSAWNRSVAVAADMQAHGLHIGAGQTVLLPDGRLDTCFADLFRGCVAPVGSILRI